MPDFSLLTASEINAMANVTAAHVCDDPNVDGMAWDVEPFDNNQVSECKSMLTQVHLLQQT